MTNVQEIPRLADVDPFVSSERARAGTLAGALALDVVMPVALLVGGIVVVTAGLPVLG